MRSTPPVTGTLVLLALLAGCERAVEPAGQDHAAEHAPPPTNRIAVPETVRRNLGIEFATVERRQVARTLRLPGAFELRPSARHEFRTPIAGRVQVLVQPLQPVRPGDLLYRLDGPAWRELQQQLGELATQIDVTALRITATRKLLASHTTHEQSLADAVAVATRRVQTLQEMRVGVGGQAAAIADAELAVTTARSNQAEAAEKEAEAAALLAELEANELAARERFERALDAVATLTGVARAQLVAPTARDGRPVPTWRTLAAIDVAATAAGIANPEPLGNGAWVAVGDLVLTVVDPALVQFRAKALQSDRPRLQAATTARIVPAARGDGAAVTGVLQHGLQADVVQRTFDLFVVPETTAPWCRAGFAAFLEIDTATGGAGELAVPASAVMTDGVQRVLFLRDPQDQDQVIRLDADLGLDDGRWIEVKSGLTDGDQVVVAGAYELMLASSGSAPKGGHFHADGTFHQDDHK